MDREIARLGIDLSFMLESSIIANHLITIKFTLPASHKSIAALRIDKGKHRRVKRDGIESVADLIAEALSRVGPNNIRPHAEKRGLSRQHTLAVAAEQEVHKRLCSTRLWVAAVLLLTLPWLVPKLLTARKPSAG